MLHGPVAEIPTMSHRQLMLITDCAGRGVEQRRAASGPHCVHGPRTPRIGPLHEGRIPV